jgi:hypothetical protein
VAKTKKKKPTIGELRRLPEAAIDAYAKQKTEPTFQLAWDLLLDFWDEAPEPQEDEDGDADHDGAHWSLCYRLVTAMDHVGFDAETDEGGDYLKTAATDVYDYVNEGGDVYRDMLSRGDDQELEDGSYLSVDLLSARVIVGETAIATQPIKRVGKKVKRNDPCPCGSGKKYKRCALRDLCIEPEIEVVDA